MICSKIADYQAGSKDWLCSLPLFPWEEVSGSELLFCWIWNGLVGSLVTCTSDMRPGCQVMPLLWQCNRHYSHIVSRVSAAHLTKLTNIIHKECTVGSLHHPLMSTVICLSCQLLQIGFERSSSVDNCLCAGTSYAILVVHKLGSKPHSGVKTSVPLTSLEGWRCTNRLNLQTLEK